MPKALWLATTAKRQRDGEPAPWGKTRADGTRHPLIDHCLDVAVVIRSLLDIETLSRVSIYDHRQKDRLAALAFLHDIGKCNWGFQAKANPDAKDTAGHVLEAMTLLCALHDAWPDEWRTLVMDMAGWFTQGDEGALQMLIAAISHHGRPMSLNDYEALGGHRLTCYWKPNRDQHPLRALSGLVQAVRCTFPAAFASGIPPIDATATLQQRFAGLVMLSDWIGSDTQFFPYRASTEEKRAEFAQAAAVRALTAIGLMPRAIRHTRDFEETFGFRPSVLQKTLCQDLSMDESTRLVVVESETGSGKTEAALAWFMRLYAAGRVDGLYFALPTRVAARELYIRVLRAVDAAFEPAARPAPVLLAVPGYVRADGLPVLPDPEGLLWDDNAQDRQQENLWSAARPKRFLAAPVAVGTIDQALLSALRVKHSLMRSVCLDRHLLVVDEVHASDSYMREVLRMLLRGHVGRGGCALLLSATLGEVAASAFFDRPILPLAEAQSRPYPSLSTHAGERAILGSGSTRSIEVTLDPSLVDDLALLPSITDALRHGARLLIVCNTVGRANALLRAVEGHFADKAPDLLRTIFSVDGVRCLHHGRYAREDREVLDAAVSSGLGKGSPARAMLLVGTQTLEQSLDIDADWLITDLAPMDVLLQRLGRLHRHVRSGRPPGFRQPCVTVRVPDKPLATYLQPAGELRGPAGLGSVYADGRILLCTLDCLSAQSVLQIPRDNRRLIEMTTHPEAWAMLPDAWKMHGLYMDGAFLANLRAADGAVMPDQPFGELQYYISEERVLTRLGDSGYDLPLSVSCTSPFGRKVERIVVPAYWLRNAPTPEVARVEAVCEDHICLDIQGCFFRYTRFGLEKRDV